MAKNTLLNSVGALAMIAVTASGCAGLKQKKRWGPAGDFVEGIIGPVWEDENPATGIGRLTVGDQLEKIDLISLLDPEVRRYDVCPDLQDGFSSAGGAEVHREFAAGAHGVARTETVRRSRKQSKKENKADRERRNSRHVQCAFAAFYTYGNSCADISTGGYREFGYSCREGRFSFSGGQAEEAAKNLALIVRRNQVQDKVIAVSENACRRFKISLNDQITKTNFSLGSSVATLAGLGAIFTDPTTSRSLAGAAAIVSGIRSEYNEAYLQSLTVHVVTKGIDAKRQDILDEINGHRYGPPFLESAQEVEYFDDLYVPINLTCTDEKGIPVECDEEDIDKRIALAKKQEDLLKEIGDRKRRKAVRYASRPYIPLSPYDKVDTALQEEYTKEVLDKKRALRKLQKTLAGVEAEIAGIRNARATAAAETKAQIGENQAEIGGKEAQKAANEEEVKRIEKKLIKSPGDRRRLSGLRKEITKLDGDIAALRGGVERLSATSGGSSAPQKIENCDAEANREDKLCIDLKANVKTLGGDCGAFPIATDDKGKCEAFRELAVEERLQCLPDSDLANGKKTLCKSAGLLAESAPVAETSDANAEASDTPVKDCSDNDAAVCTALKEKIQTAGGSCSIASEDAAETAKCDAFGKLTAEEKLQCVPDTKFDADKKELCQTAGLLDQSAAPQTPAPKAASTAEAPSGALVELNSRKASLENEIRTLNTRIGKLEDMFGGELAKVDALVGLVPISQYTVELALADALRFHAACTIPSGLEKAADSVEKIQSPGFETVRQGIDNMINIQKRMNKLEELRKSPDADDESDE
jgi:hypothetical protein